MKFEYHRPANLEAALKFLGGGVADCAPLAGGTDLLVMIQEELISPRVLLDISGLKELNYIREADGRIEIGALVTHGQAASSELLRAKASLLAQSCLQVGSPQIRALGTIGGNLVMGSPCGDTIPALYALEASLVLKSADGTRTVAIGDFFTGVKKNVRRTEELLTAINFPIPEPSARGFFNKLGQRKALAIAKVSVAGLVFRRRGEVEKIRVALGAVGPTAIRALQTEEYLTGRSLDPETIAAARTICSGESRAITDLRSNAGYRDRMAGVLLARGLNSIL